MQTATDSPAEPVDFLPDLLGELGNVWSLLGIVRAQCDDQGLDYAQWRAELDQRAVDRSYDELLQQVERWFGPQGAADEYRAHVTDAG